MPSLLLFLLLFWCTHQSFIYSQSLINYYDFSENIVSKCDFSANACHFRNQHNLAKYQRYFNTLKTFFDRNWMLLLNINSERVRRYPGARLITPYYPSKYQNACLFVAYRYIGSGFERFFIIQQDRENKCIFADDRSLSLLSNSQENIWNQIEIQLDLKDGDARFFVETHFNHRNKKGYFALGNFTIGYGNCRNKIENHCYDQLANRYINVAPTVN